MVNSLMAVITASIIPVLFSSLSRLQNNETAYKRMYYTAQRYTAYLVFPMGLGLFLFSDLGTDIMFGNKWVEASDIVGIMALLAVFKIVFSNFNGEVYRSKGKPKLSFLSQVIYLCFLVPACLISIRYGFWSFVYTRTLFRLLNVLIGFIFMKVFMNFSIKEMAMNVYKPAIGSLLMGVLAIALKNVSGSTMWSFLSIFICVIFYGGIMLVISKNDLVNILQILKSRKIVNSAED